MSIISKAGTRIADTYDFVLSTETPDRVGDIVKIDAMDVKTFESNPVALYMHDHNQPIGAWSNLRKQAGVLIGTLNLATKGTSKIVDFARTMLAQGMLKAVSVSFIPLDSKANANGRGRTISKSELIEVSVVTVPMNSQALMIAKAVGFDDAEIKSLFESGEIADELEQKQLAEQKNLRFKASLHRSRLATIQAKRASRPLHGEL